MCHPLNHFAFKETKSKLIVKNILLAFKQSVVCICVYVWYGMVWYFVANKISKFEP